MKQAGLWKTDFHSNTAIWQCAPHPAVTLPFNPLTDTGSYSGGLTKRIVPISVQIKLDCSNPVLTDLTR